MNPEHLPSFPVSSMESESPSPPVQKTSILGSLLGLPAKLLGIDRTQGVNREIESRKKFQAERDNADRDEDEKFEEVDISPVSRESFDNRKKLLSPLERVMTHREPGEFRDSFDFRYDKYGKIIGVDLPQEDLEDDARRADRAAAFAESGLSQIEARTGKTAGELVQEVETSKEFDVPGLSPQEIETARKIRLLKKKSHELREQIAELQRDSRPHRTGRRIPVDDELV